MESLKNIRVEVAYAKPDEQVLISVEVLEGTTAQQAIEKSNILQLFPEIDLGQGNKIGIFNKPCALNTSLREGDRVEIYRPLIADPKQVRKQRVAEGKMMG
jgi:putative ubiquitin-RnfH superfamily antitoxin RatB of RatAB toxin-antitoxin module